MLAHASSGAVDAHFLCMPHRLCAGNLIKLFFRNLEPKLLDAFDGDTLKGMMGKGKDNQFTVRASMASVLGMPCLHIFAPPYYRCICALTGVRCLATDHLAVHIAGE